MKQNFGGHKSFWGATDNPTVSWSAFQPSLLDPRAGKTIHKHWWGSDPQPWATKPSFEPLHLKMSILRNAYHANVNMSTKNVTTGSFA